MLLINRSDDTARSEVESRGESEMAEEPSHTSGKF